MQREIKFRVWDKVKQEWHYFTPDNLSMYIKEWTDHRLNGDEFLQYTGLKDKQGKEIYEGDVVEVDPVWLECSDKGLIYWDDGRAAFRMSFPDGDIWDINEDIGSSEVIGNIYEHPHLLEAHAQT